MNGRLAPSPAPAQIAALRTSHALTQAQAAALLHTSVRSYRQWEIGERRMHAALWDCMRFKLGVRIS